MKTIEEKQEKKIIVIEDDEKNIKIFLNNVKYLMKFYSQRFGEMRDFGSDYADSIDYVESHYKSKYSYDNDFSEYEKSGVGS